MIKSYLEPLVWPIIPVSWIFFGEPLDSLGEVVCVLLVLRFDGHRDDRVRNENGLHAQVLRLVQDKRVT